MERNTISKLPEDILKEILVRVPVESMVKCICVCEKWRTTIRSEYFKDAYWTRSMTRPRLLFRYREYPRQTPNKLSYTVYQQEKPLLSSGLKQMPISSPPEYEMISSPQRGLVCLRSRNKFVLYNPGTNKFKALPECEPPRGLPYTTYFFGYDDVTNTFKVLMSHMSIIKQMPLPPQVLTVKLAGNSLLENSWRPIECHQRKYFPHMDSHSLCIKGVLYYVAWSVVERDKYIVISFDLGSEKFTVIDSPDGVKVSIGATLVNYNGKVCLVNDLGKELEDGSREFEIYVKDESADMFRAEPLVILGWRDIVGDLSFYFKGTIGTAGELVFANESLHDGSHFVLYYNTATENLRKFKIEEVDGSSYGHVETFLNHYDSLLLT